MHRNLRTYGKQRLRNAASYSGDPSLPRGGEESRQPKRSSSSLNSRRGDMRGESGIQNNPICKRVRASPSPTNSQDDAPPTHWRVPDTPSAYQTPYPTVLNESQKFRIESSLGITLSPNHQFSPVPAPVQRRTSRNLKENANKLVGTKQGRKSGSKLLASPFSSRPGSVASSPARPRTQTFETTTQPKPTRTLSDTHFNANLPAPNDTLTSVAPLDLAPLSRTDSNIIKSRIKPKPALKPKPQAQSTTTSPTTTVSPRALASRRPSVPTSARPTTESWIPVHNPAVNLHLPSVDLELDLSSSLGKPDFNRPPSQLTYFPEFDDSGHFDFNSSEILSISTPFGSHARAGKNALDRDGSSGSDEGQDKTSSPHFAPDSPIQRPRLRSPWLSDSLISPPTVYSGEESAYMPDPNTPSDPGTVADGTIDAPVSVEANSEPDEILGELLESFGLSVDISPIAPPVTPPSAQKNKSDLPPPGLVSPRGSPIKGRARRSTLKPSDFPPPRALPITRTRSGSVIRQVPLEATLSKRSRSDTIRGSELSPISALAGGARRMRSGTILSANDNTSGAKRTRSGTITAAPSLRAAPLPTAAGPAESGAAGPGSVLVEERLEEVDELLLKSPWKEPEDDPGEWKAAERTSPLAIRNAKRGKLRLGFHQKRINSNATVDADSLGRDDEIMLKPGFNYFG